jgi:hypothetical protein
MGGLRRVAVAGGIVRKVGRFVDEEQERTFTVLPKRGSLTC